MKCASGHICYHCILWVILTFVAKELTLPSTSAFKAGWKLLLNQREEQTRREIRKSAGFILNLGSPIWWRVTCPAMALQQVSGGQWLFLLPGPAICHSYWDPVLCHKLLWKLHQSTKQRSLKAPPACLVLAETRGGETWQVKISKWKCIFFTFLQLGQGTQSWDQNIV